jgi:hypothetical protein
MAGMCVVGLMASRNEMEGEKEKQGGPGEMTRTYILEGRQRSSV